MKIALITPAARRSRAGNRATATRWARFLRELGHRVHVAESYDGRRVDAMIALHAWRTAESIHAFSEAYPQRALIAALTGTDVYKFQHSHPETTVESMTRAHALIGLHDRVADDIPPRFHAKLHTVYQSAHPLPRSYPGPNPTRFDICVAGHLREEKDSLRAAYAVRELSAESRLRLIQVGRAHSPDWEVAAREEMAVNPRFHWRGEIPQWQVRRLMAHSRLMVMSSVMEGGANVVSEACVAGLAIVASDIPGNRGLLGDDYPGYFPPQDTAALRDRLLRAERDAAFLERLRAHCASRAPLFRPDAERDGLDRVLRTVTEARPQP